MNAIVHWIEDDREDDLPQDTQVPGTASLTEWAEILSHQHGGICWLEWKPGVNVWQGNKYREVYG